MKYHLAIKKDEILLIWNKIIGIWRHHVGWNKPNIERQIAHIHSYTRAKMLK